MKFRAGLLAAGFAVALASAAYAQAVQGLDGRWAGAIVMPNGVSITGVFRVVTKNGLTTAVFDLPDQGATGIPASVKREGDKVTFDVPAAMLTYTASLSADGKTLAGDMNQRGNSVPLTMTQKPAAAAPTGLPISGLDGRWEGVIPTPSGDIAVVFRFSTAKGRTTTLMDTPGQGAAGVPALASREGEKISIDVPGIGGNFTADLSADGKTLTGTWSQSDQSFPLIAEKK